MTELLTFSADQVAPDRTAVLTQQGIPTGRVIPAETEALYTQAVHLLAEVVAPVGILQEVSRSEFEVIYHGEGLNDPQTPVADIATRADRLALFAVTVGQRVSAEIQERFGSNDLALAAMLDSAASAAADKSAQLAETRFREALSNRGQTAPDTSVLSYSPGYCGWDISGQKKLFAALKPERIGIALRDSFVMEPLKSITGVIIAGPREIHSFPASYPFCSRCEARGCRDRIRALLAGTDPNAA